MSFKYNDYDSVPEMLKIYDINKNKNKKLSVNVVQNKEKLYNVTFNNLSLKDLDILSKCNRQFTSDELDEMIYHQKMRRSIKNKSNIIYMLNKKKQNLGIGDIVKIDNKILMTKSCNYYRPYHTFTELSTLKEYDYDLGQKKVEILLSQNVKFDIETYDIKYLKNKLEKEDLKIKKEIKDIFLPEVMNNVEQELLLKDISIKLTNKIINECVDKLATNYENINNNLKNECLDSILTQYSDDFEEESDNEDINNRKDILSNYINDCSENITNVINNKPKVVIHNKNNINEKELYPIIDKLICDIHDIQSENDNINEKKKELDNEKNITNLEEEEKGYCVVM
jgi:hypothetical protein